MRYFFFAIAIIFPVTISAQSERKHIRQGNHEYQRGQFEEAEVLYRKANEINRRLPETFFNIGTALYKQEKFEDAANQFTANIAMNEDIEKKAAGLYNLGNSYLQAGKFNESIEAYKESLRLQPNNFEAKYNLAYAQDLLQEQEEQQQDDNNQDNQNNQENDSSDNSQDQQNQDSQYQNNEERNQQQQEQPSISREDAERILNSLANEDREVQERVRLRQAAQERRSSVRNW